METDNAQTKKTGVDRDEFYRRISELYNQKSDNTFLLPKVKYDLTIEKVKAALTHGKKTPGDYRRIKRYEVVNTPEGERLFMPRQPGQTHQQMYVPVEEIYDIIREYHIKMNHAGRSRLMVAIKPKYKNITSESVLLYLSLCNMCKESRKNAKRPRKSNQFGNSSLSQITAFDTSVNNASDGESVEECSDREPFTSVLNNTEDKLSNVNKENHEYPELYSRGQVDILDVTNTQNEEYKYMMVYRNFVTKFTHLYPLRSISIEEIVNSLLDIFLVFGAPNILQSKNGMPVTKPICRRIATVCPDIKLVAADVSSAASFKGKSNEVILRKLCDWLEANINSKWQYGLKHVQHSLNTSFNSSICMSPCQLIFGANPKKGLASIMSHDEYEDLDTENDLKMILDEKLKPGKRFSTQLKLEESLIRPCSFVKIEMESMEEGDDIIGDVDDSL